MLYKSRLAHVYIPNFSPSRNISCP